LKPAKNSYNLLGEFPSCNEHWQNCYGTVEDDFLEIDAIIGHVFFDEFAVANHIPLTVRKRGRFWPPLKKKQELGGSRFINRLAYFTNICLGRLECCKFSQNSDVASSAKWKHALILNKSLWFSGLGAGLSP
jgi:hypothetical protein